MTDKTETPKATPPTPAAGKAEFKPGELPPGCALVRYVGDAEPATHPKIGMELWRGRAYCVVAVLAAHLVDRIDGEFEPFRDEDRAAIDKVRADHAKQRQDARS